MTYDFILFSVNDGVAEVTMNRPDRLNALNRSMLEELRHALDRIEAEQDLRCLLLKGAGRGFCSGADLTDPDLVQIGDPGVAVTKYFNPLAQSLMDLSVPIVAAVRGPCAGAGMSLAMAADIVVAAKSAEFLQAFSRIGLVPDAGASYLLPRLVGTARAAGMMLLGEKLSAEQAHEWGLVWQLVEDGELDGLTGGLAAKLARGPTAGLSLARRLLNASQTNDFATQIALEAESQSLAAKTEDHIEGVTAFLEKRPAVFKGR